MIYKICFYSFYTRIGLLLQTNYSPPYPVKLYAEWLYWILNKNRRMNTHNFDWQFAILRLSVNRTMTEFDTSTHHVPTTSWGKPVTGEKSPFLALVLSFFFPGVGIMYAGRVGLGLVILLLSVFLAVFVIGLIFWIYGMYKGYSMCSENNRLWAQYLASR